jgi:hypothetical protein
MVKNLGKRAIWLSIADLGLISTHQISAAAAELSRFAGTTDYAGLVAVTTSVAATDGMTMVDVAATFESTTMFWLGVQYLVEEVSYWRGGQLESVAVNSRYLVGNHIVRQQVG